MGLESYQRIRWLMLPNGQGSVLSICQPKWQSIPQPLPPVSNTYEDNECYQYNITLMVRTQSVTKSSTSAC